MARRGCGLVVLSAGLALALGGCGGPDAPTTRPAAEGAADANRARPSGRAPDERTTKPAVPEPPQPVDDPRIAFRIGRLKSTDWRERWQALSELRQMGADAAPAVPWIAKALKDDVSAVRCQAAAALEWIGPAARDAIPGLAACLLSDDRKLHDSAAYAIERIGAPPIDCLPTLLKALDAGNPMPAAIVLRMMGSAARPAAGVLGRLLGDESPDVRCSALKSLTALGPIARAAAPAITPLLRSSSAKERGQAVWALSRIGGPAPEAVAVLAEMMRSEPDKSVRLNAIPALAAAGAAGLPHVCAALREGDESMRRAAAESLGKAGGKARTAARDLIEALGDADLHVRGKAAWALAQVVPDSEESARAVSGCLRDDHVGVRAAAVRALAVFGAKAGAATGGLVHVMRGDPSPRLRGDAAKALAAVAPERPAFIRALVAALADRGVYLSQGHKETLVSRVAEDILVEIGDPALPEIVKALVNRNAFLRHNAARAVVRIGPMNADAVVAAYHVVDGRDIEARLEALELLTKIGPGAARALPALLRLMEDPDQPEAVRQAAARAYRSVGHRRSRPAS